MPVFKLCLKIIKRNLPVMLIYVFIFLFISTVITSMTQDIQQKGFTQSQAQIAFFDNDRTTLTEGFRKELLKTAQIVDLPDEKQALQDALFFRTVTYILSIPEGFTQSMLEDGDLKLEKKVVPGSVENTYVDLSVEQYWNLARLYIQADPDIPPETLVQNLSADLALETPVELLESGTAKTAGSFASYFFNYLAYTLSAVLLLGIATIMLVFNNRDITRRNYCAPLSSTSINVQLLLAILLFTAGAWLIMSASCFLFDSKSLGAVNIIYILMNSWVFAVSMSCMGFMVGSLLKDKNALSAVCNVFTLGPCFISGVFVPQELLGDTVLRIASFTPTYWYVKSNSQIAALTRFDLETLSPIFMNMFIILCFGAAFFCVSLVITKRKQANT